MSKAKRPGIFDPWRQDDAPEEAPKKVELPRSMARVAPAESTPTTNHVVQYQGTNGGVSVWLEGSPRETSGMEARDRLIGALKHLVIQVPHFQSALEAANLYLEAPANGSFVTMLGTNQQLRIAVPGNKASVHLAFDRLAMGLRRLQGQFPAVKRYFEQVKIKPYVK